MNVLTKAVWVSVLQPIRRHRNTPNIATNKHILKPPKFIQASLSLFSATTFFSPEVPHV